MKIFLKSILILLLSGLLISCDSAIEGSANNPPTLQEIRGAANTLRKFGKKIRKQDNVLDSDDKKALKAIEKIHFPTDKAIKNDAVMSSSMNFITQDFKTIDSITGDPIESCGPVQNSANNNPTVCNYEFTELPEIVKDILNSEGALTGKVMTSNGEKTVTIGIVIKAFNAGSWCETDILAGKGYQNCIEPIRR